METTKTETWAITYVLIAINLLVFMISVAMGDSVSGSSSTNGLVAEAATWGAAIDLDNEWWRLISGGFLHHGVIHLAVNMFSLYVLGFPLERVVGKSPFVAVYGAALLGGSFGALWETPNALVAGASGAIFGLMGALLALSIAQGVGIFQTPIGPILLINLAISLTVDQVSLGGHLGGLVAGVIVGGTAVLAWRVQKFQIMLPALTAVLLSGVSVAGGLWAASRWMTV